LDEGEGAGLRSRGSLTLELTNSVESVMGGSGSEIQLQICNPARPQPPGVDRRQPASAGLVKYIEVSTGVSVAWPITAFTSLGSNSAFSPNFGNFIRVGRSKGIVHAHLKPHHPPHHLITG